MEDNRIVDLYWARSEDAIAETSEKYGKYCYAIAYNILSNTEDADESVNDTYLDAWHNMPPHRPSILSTFLGKITRRISIDKWRGRTADKRGGGEIVLALDELVDCVPSDHTIGSSPTFWTRRAASASVPPAGSARGWRADGSGPAGAAHPNRCIRHK
jgi:hypothetical protein